MKAQKPAEGILLVNEWGPSKGYKITCGCGQEWHEHHVDIEADETGVSVNIYGTVKTDCWTETFKTRFRNHICLEKIENACKSFINGIIRKVKLTWELWITGVISVETTISMTEQQALNYSEALKSAIEDVKTFRKNSDA